MIPGNNGIIYLQASGVSFVKINQAPFQVQAHSGTIQIDGFDEIGDHVRAFLDGNWAVGARKGPADGTESNPSPTIMSEYLARDIEHRGDVIGDKVRTFLNLFKRGGGHANRVSQLTDGQLPPLPPDRDQTYTVDNPHRIRHRKRIAMAARLPIKAGRLPVLPCGPRHLPGLRP